MGFTHELTLASDNGLIEVRETPRHLPPRKDVQETDLLEDPTADLEAEERSARAAGPGLLDRVLTTREEDRLVADAVARASLYAGVAPHVAAEAALDLALWSGVEGGSLFEVASHATRQRLLSRVLAALGVPASGPPSTADDLGPHYTGIGALDAARARLSSVLEDLTAKREALRGSLRDLDSRLDALRRDESYGAIWRRQAEDSLRAVEESLGAEVQKLQDYEGFLASALKRAVEGAVAAVAGQAPLVTVQLAGAVSGAPGHVVLEFKVEVAEVFDAGQDPARFAIKNNAVRCLDPPSVLAAAAAAIRKKLNVVRRAFERSLGADVEVVAGDVRGAPVPADSVSALDAKYQYRAAVAAQLRVTVRVYDEDSVAEVTKVVAEVLADLLSAEYGALASRGRVRQRP